MTTPTNSAPVSDLLADICTNWALAIPLSAIPSTILPSRIPSEWPLSLIQSLHTLSSLTAGNITRAHNLLTTYCLDRTRGGKPAGRRNLPILALEVEDVENAIASLRRIIGGQSVERRGSAMPQPESEEEKGMEEVASISGVPAAGTGTKRKASEASTESGEEEDDRFDNRPTKFLRSSSSSTSSTTSSQGEQTSNTTPSFTPPIDEPTTLPSRAPPRPLPTRRKSSLSTTGSPSEFWYKKPIPSPSGSEASPNLSRQSHSSPQDPVHLPQTIDPRRLSRCPTPLSINTSAQPTHSQPPLLQGYLYPALNSPDPTLPPPQPQPFPASPYKLPPIPHLFTGYNGSEESATARTLHPPNPTRLYREILHIPAPPSPSYHPSTGYQPHQPHHLYQPYAHTPSQHPLPHATSPAYPQPQGYPYPQQHAQRPYQPPPSPYIRRLSLDASTASSQMAHYSYVIASKRCSIAQFPRSTPLVTKRGGKTLKQTEPRALQVLRYELKLAEAAHEEARVRYVVAVKRRGYALGEMGMQGGWRTERFG